MNYLRALATPVFAGKRWIQNTFFFFKTEENPTVYERILQETKNRSTFLNTETNGFENIFVMKKNKSLETNIIILKVQVVVPFYKLAKVHPHKPRVRYIINGWLKLKERIKVVVKYNRLIQMYIGGSKRRYIIGVKQVYDQEDKYNKLSHIDERENFFNWNKQVFK